MIEHIRAISQGLPWGSYVMLSWEDNNNVKRREGGVLSTMVINECDSCIVTLGHVPFEVPFDVRIEEVKHEGSSEW